MKKLYMIAAILVLAVSLCACRMGITAEKTEPNTTEAPATTQPVTVPSMPPIEPNVPETTEKRGSTDDKQDDPNETIGNDMDENMRRRIMG